MAQLILILAFWAGCVAAADRRARVTGGAQRTLRGRAQAIGSGIFLLPLVLMIGGLFRPATVPIVLLLLAAGLLAVLFPPVAARLLPFALIGLGLYGPVLMAMYTQGTRALGTHWRMRPPAYGVVSLGPLWSRYFLPLQMWAFLVLGGWLLWRWLRRQPWAARVLHVRRGEMTRPRWGLLLIPLAVAAAELFSQTWFASVTAGLTFTIGAILIVFVLIRRLPSAAADLAVLAVTAFGLYSAALAVLWPQHIPVPSLLGIGDGLVFVADRQAALLAGAQGLALIAAACWLVPRALDDRTRALFWPGPDPALAQRVQRLTQTRADAVDSAAAELRRVERDLRDGAQARLVALGMSLRAAERLITSSPQAALELIAEARDSSSKALTELRDLVRGIYPPVLADRGLADAVRALALDTPLRTEVYADLPGRADAPVESACYFAVAETLANAVKHADASRVLIEIRHSGGMLRIEVTDDGAGGADPAKGSGLRGLERRLAAFDGIVAVSSPPAGPTLVVIEVPCALSSPKITSR